jgi:hypothetical protein
MKKKIFYTIISVAIISSNISAQEKQEKADKKPQAEEVLSNAEISFDKEQHDYGTIEQGANGVYEFKFTNTGKDPLIISNCKGSCGCTVPSWPKEPIRPGGSGAIKVSYDTKRIGAFNKTVTISSNAKSSNKTISIKGVVNAKPEEETFPGKKAGFGVPLESK